MHLLKSVVVLLGVAAYAAAVGHLVSSRPHLTTGTGVEISVDFNSLQPLDFNTKALIPPNTKCAVQTEVVATRRGSLISSVICIRPEKDTVITPELSLACFGAKYPFDNPSVRQEQLNSTGSSSNWMLADDAEYYFLVLKGDGNVEGSDGLPISKNYVTVNVNVHPIGSTVAAADGKDVTLSPAALRGLATSTTPAKTPSIDLATIGGVQESISLSVAYSTVRQTVLNDQDDFLYTELFFSGGLDPASTAVDLLGVVVNSDIIPSEFTLAVFLSKAEAEAGSNAIDTCTHSGKMPLPSMSCSICLDPDTPSVWARVTMTSHTQDQKVNLVSTLSPLA